MSLYEDWEPTLVVCLVGMWLSIVVLKYNSGPLIQLLIETLTHLGISPLPNF